MFPAHQWGSDPQDPDTTRCVWCHAPFIKAGGTACPMNDHAREAAVEATTRLMVTDLPVEPERRGTSIEGAVDAVLICALVAAIAIIAAAIFGLTKTHPAKHSGNDPVDRTAAPARYFPA